MAQGERLMKLQLEAMRGMLDDSMKGAKSLMEARDPQQWGALQQKNMQDMLARLTEYSRSVQDLAGKTQKEIGELVESRAGAMNAQFQGMVDEMAKSAPPGSEGGIRGDEADAGGDQCAGRQHDQDRAAIHQVCGIGDQGGNRCGRQRRQGRRLNKAARNSFL